MTQDTPRRECWLSDCDKPAVCRDMCHGHYRRWRKYGDPLVTLRKGRRKRKGPQLHPSFNRHYCGACTDSLPYVLPACRDCAIARDILAEPAGENLVSSRFVPAAPLHAALRAQIARHGDIGTAMSALGITDARDSQRIFHQIMKREQIRVVEADKYATALGLHLDVLWPGQVSA